MSEVQPDAGLMSLIGAVLADDLAAASTVLALAPELARARAGMGAPRQKAGVRYLTEISHYLYRGDTALHIAAAANRPEMVRMLMAAGADVEAQNCRGAQPLHYAADAVPGSPAWDPRAQSETVTTLIEAGADPNASDNSGVAPLHRAVRCRCAEAVRALLQGGADPRRVNGRGSTPLPLATWTTGRGGSGSPESLAQQVEILALLHEALGSATRSGPFPVR